MRVRSDAYEALPLDAHVECAFAAARAVLCPGRQLGHELELARLARQAARVAGVLHGRPLVQATSVRHPVEGRALRRPEVHRLRAGLHAPTS